MTSINGVAAPGISGEVPQLELPACACADARVSEDDTADSPHDGGAASASALTASGEGAIVSQEEFELEKAYSSSNRVFNPIPFNEAVYLLASLWSSFQNLKGAIHTQRNRSSSHARHSSQIPAELMQNYRAMQLRINVIRSAKIIAKCSRQPDSLVVHNDNVQAKILNMTRYGSVHRAFYAVDVSAILSRLADFKQLFPEFSAEVRVNGGADDILMCLFNQLNIGFRLDCASDVELLQNSYRRLHEASMLTTTAFHSDATGDMHMQPASFVYDSAPIRSGSHIKSALVAGVRTFVVDCVDEAKRIQQTFDRLQLQGNVGYVLMIRAAHCTNALHELYGADQSQFQKISKSMSRKNMKMVGLSMDLSSASKAGIKDAFSTLQAAMQLFGDVKFISLQGIDTLLLNTDTQASSSIIAELRTCVRRLKHERNTLRFMCDATRFLVKGTHTLNARVIGAKLAYDANSGEVIGNHYYIDDGCYGGFSRTYAHSQAVLGLNTTSCDEFNPSLTVVGGAPTQQVVSATVWGQTCDSVDCIFKDRQLPAISTDSWLSFGDMEDACNTFCTKFNGFGPAERRYFVSLSVSN